jgi:DNA gyrase inhibitor GyrI
MELLKPPLTAVVIVEVPWLPCATVREEGDAETVKSPCVAVAAWANNKILNKLNKQMHKPVLEA